MDYFDKAKDLYNQAVKAVSKTETEKKLAEALSNANWGASTTLQREIAGLTHDWQEYGVVMREIFATLSLPPRNWRQIFKALTLLEYLVKNGAERCVQEAKDRVHQVRSLTGFSYYHEGAEKGTGVRERAKALLELIGDEELIKEERSKAVVLRDKYTGMGRDGSRSTLPSGGMGGGGSGRYDDFKEPSFGAADAAADAVVAAKKEKKKKKKDKEKKREKAKKSKDDDDDDFDFGDNGGDAFGDFEGTGSAAADDDDFGGFGGAEDEAKKKKKDKKKKDKEKKKKKAQEQEQEEDLFGGPAVSAAAAPVAAAAASAAAAPSDSFDPFSDFAASAGSAAPAAAPAPAPAPGLAAAMPASRMEQPQLPGAGASFGAFAAADDFGAFASPSPPAAAAGGVDLFAASAAPAAPAPMQPAAAMSAPATAPATAPASNDPWGGLVNLGNLSLNAGEAQSPQSPRRSSLSEQQRRMSAASAGSAGGSMMMGSPIQQQPQAVPMQMQAPMQMQTPTGMQQMQPNMMMMPQMQQQQQQLPPQMQQQQQQQQQQNNLDLLF